MKFSIVFIKIFFFGTLKLNSYTPLNSPKICLDRNENLNMFLR